MFNGSLYIKWLNSTIWPIDGTLGLVCFFCFNVISNLFRLFNAKAILLEEQ